jgi:nucleoid DNA-binding protein
MTWNELVKRVVARGGVGRTATTAVLDALLVEVSDAIVDGETVTLPRVCRVSSSWRDARTLRSVEDGRKMMLDGRFVARFRVSGVLRERLATRTQQVWKRPEHQQAWRVAETLVGDLALYHGELAPRDLTPQDPPGHVEQVCAVAFGSHWERVVSMFTTRAAGVNEPYLALAARRRWAS